jgi:deferrochelatase/peroxidase EfeB
VPAESLATFPSEFQQGMAARADYIGDVGESAPENWEAPLGSKDVHVVVAALARDTSLMETLVRLAQDAVRNRPGVTPVWTLDVHVPPDGREQFGFKDSISEPAVEGTDILGSNPHEAPLKAGEFVLGYQDETGDVRPVPQPEVLGRNGTYVAFRKLHQRVAAFRQYLGQNAADDAERGVACGQVRRALAQRRAARPRPGQGRPRTGRRSARNNAFHVRRRPAGLKCPVGAHARRMNARDAVITGQVRLHRMIRRGTNYGPSLPPACWRTTAPTAAHVRLRRRAPDRQFEFVQRSGSTTASSSARPPSGTR